MLDLGPLSLTRRVALYTALITMMLGRFVFYLVRRRLYRKHQATFERTQPEALTDSWRRAIAGGPGSAAAYVLVTAIYAGGGFLASFHPRLRPALGGLAMGVLLFAAAVSVCLESYYLVNRLLALARPQAARRSFMKAPRTGLVLEAILVAYVMLTSWIACAAAPVPHLIGGVCATTFIFLNKVARVFTQGRRFAADAERMRETGTADTSEESGSVDADDAQGTS